LEAALGFKADVLLPGQPAVDLTGKGLEGAFVEGTGIPTGTTVISIMATSLTLSQAAVGSNTGIAIRLLPWGQGDASTTFNVPDRRGIVLAGRDNMGGTAKGLPTLLQDGRSPRAPGSPASRDRLRWGGPRPLAGRPPLSAVRCADRRCPR
jgi:hypothetical protein